MKVAFYLGSFNPIHYGHLTVINDGLQRFGMDKIVVVPAMHNPDKKKPAPFDIRCSWVERACKEFPENLVEIDRIEESMIPPYYSYATLHALRTKYCNDETYLLVGEDLVDSIKDWMNGGQILKDWDLLVVDRPNGSLSSSLYRQCPVLFSMFIPDIIKDEVYYYYNEHEGDNSI